MSAAGTLPPLFLRNCLSPCSVRGYSTAPTGAAADDGPVPVDDADVTVTAAADDDGGTTGAVMPGAA